MTYQEIVIVLAGHSFEDFPVYHEGEEADSLLASWTALWHPALLAAAQALPTWRRIDEPPIGGERRLYVVPLPMVPDLPHDFSTRAGNSSVVVSGQTDRQEIVRQALEPLGPLPAVAEDLVRDFFALGYAYLQMQLLTRHMRYTSGMEETSFAQQAVEAAQAALAGQEPTAREHLQACFDFLAQERNHYYAVDVFLIDLALVAPGHAAAALARELPVCPPAAVAADENGNEKTDGTSPPGQAEETPAAGSCPSEGGAPASPVNLLLDGQTLDQILQNDLALRSQLSHALQAGAVGLASGHYGEIPNALLAQETILASLRRGLAAFTRQLDYRPEVYGRRRFGLTPILPQILNKLGFRGVLHATLDDGQFPEATQAKSRWEGLDQTSLDAIMRAPLDASRSATFLNLAGSLSESMDMDHVATRGLAHWAGEVSVWHEDLRRVARYTSALGKFVTLQDYFQDAYDPGMHDRFNADQYRSPYLKQAVANQQTHPIASCVRYWQRQVTGSCLQALATILVLVRNDATTRQQYHEVEQLIEQLESAADPLQPDPEGTDDLDAQLQSQGQNLVQQLSRVLGKAGPSESNAQLVVNPFSFARRSQLTEHGLSPLPAVEKPVYAVDSESPQQPVVVDTPGMGFTFVVPGQSAPRRRAEPPLAEGVWLRNEFFEAQIDEATGTLRSIRDYRARSTRLSQQLALRQPYAGHVPAEEELGEGPDPRYTVMAADGMEVVRADRTVGEIETHGRLLDREGTLVARFRQRYRLQRGSRMLGIDIELSPEVMPGTDPWNSYYACRFAWSNEAAELARNVNNVRRPTSARRMEAPLFIEIDDAASRTTIFSGGLPYHRRVGRRMLDTILLVRGEQQRQFRLGVGVDVKQPFREALDLLAPVYQLPTRTDAARSMSTWLFHLDVKNLMATHWEAVWQEAELVGVRCRLVETEGRSTQAAVTCFREVDSARKIDFVGQTIQPCDVQADKVRIPVSPHEWMQLEILFKA